MPLQSNSQHTSYDFTICKLCGRPSGVATYILGSGKIYACRDCDFHYLDRLDPPPDNTPAMLTDQQLTYMNDRLASNARVLATRLKLVQSFIEPGGQHCLDVGTGVGQFLMLLKETGAFCEGIEPSQLRRTFAHRRFDLTLHPEPVEESFWIDRHETFDLLTLWDVLEHVNDPVTTLKAAFALLKPGGLIFIETDNRDCSSYRLSCLLYRLTRGGTSLFLPNFYRPVPYGHKQIFRAEQLYALSSRCGFELIAATPHGKAAPRVKTSAYRPHGQIILVVRKPLA